MALSKRTKRRSLILLAVLAGLGVSIAVLYQVQQMRRAGRAETQHSRGIAAYEQGDYAQAIKDLAQTIRYYQDDAETYRLLARANLDIRPRLPHHYRDGLNALRRYHELNPDDIEAMHELLALSVDTGLGQIAVPVAEARLRDEPEDTVARKYYILALGQLGRYEDARPLAETFIAQYPLEYRVQLLFQEMLFEAGWNPLELLGRAQGVLALAPDDPGMRYVAAHAFIMNNQAEPAAAHIRFAANQTIDDPFLADRMLAFLDVVNEFNVAYALLIQTTQTLDDDLLFDEALRRMYEHGDYTLVLQAMSTRPLDNPRMPLDQLGLLALSAAELGDEAGMRGAMNALVARRDGEPMAAGWVEAIRSLNPNEQRTPAERIALAKAAVDKVPDHPYFNLALGQAYRQAMESDLAAEPLRVAAAGRPSWAEARRLLADTYLDIGMSEQALLSARAAALRDPESIEARVAYARASYAELNYAPLEAVEDLLRVAAAIQRQQPGEPVTLVLAVELLSLMGAKDAAVGAAQPALDGTVPVPEQTLIELSLLSREYGLGFEQQAAQTIANRFGMTPNLAYQGAYAQAQRGNREAGRAIIEQAVAQHPDDADAWVNRARFLDLIASPDAAQAWAETLERFGDEISVLDIFVSSSAGRRHRELAAQAIDQMRVLAGEQTGGWRVARAEWLLSRPGGLQDSDMAAVVRLLEDWVDVIPGRPNARLMLGEALARQGSIVRAAEQLEKLSDRWPNNAVVAIRLAELYQEAEAFAQAETVLDDLVETLEMTRDQRRRVAWLYARQGATDSALALFQWMDEQGELTDPRDLQVVAELYAQSGRIDEADVAFQRALRFPNPAAIASAASFYEGIGLREQAHQALARLAQVPGLGEADRQAVLANYATQIGDDEAALAAMQRRAELAAGDPSSWLSLIRYLISRGELTQAKATAQAAVMRAESSVLSELVEHRELLDVQPDNDMLRGVRLALLGNTSQRQAARAALQAASTQTGEVYLSTLDELIEQYPQVMAIGALRVRLLTDAGAAERAARFADELMRAHPGAAEPAFLAARAWFNAQQYSNALQAADQFRRRTTGRSLDADVMVANVQLQIGQFSQALERLEPYMERAQQYPNEYAQIIERYTLALAGTQSYSRAWDILEPLTSGEDGARWRRYAMQLVVTQVDTPSAARRWLQRLEAASPADAMEERVLLAQAYRSVGTRNGEDTRLIAASERLVQELVQLPDASAEAWLMQGMLHEDAGQVPAAIAAYREAIARAPETFIAHNNLALLLAEVPESIDEAVRLAGEAVSSDPTNVSYLDTLAQVQSQAGRHDAAIETIIQAVRLRPDELRWQNRLREVLQNAGREDDWVSVLQSIQRGG